VSRSGREDNAGSRKSPLTDPDEAGLKDSLKFEPSKSNMNLINMYSCISHFRLVSSRDMNVMNLVAPNTWRASPFAPGTSANTGCWIYADGVVFQGGHVRISSL